ncbi:MAG: transposase domain-containing protein [Oscillospiraceae bacterium]|nr:transposase domain-containing protein [Oscillospiraceae bacterium]
MIETVNRNSLNPYKYLKYLLTVLSTLRETPTVSQIKSVMPWSLTIPTICRNPEL